MAMQSISTNLCLRGGGGGGGAGVSAPPPSASFSVHSARCCRRAALTRQQQPPPTAAPLPCTCPPQKRPAHFPAQARPAPPPSGRSPALSALFFVNCSRTEMKPCCLWDLVYTGACGAGGGVGSRMHTGWWPHASRAVARRACRPAVAVSRAGAAGRGEAGRDAAAKCKPRTAAQGSLYVPACLREFSPAGGQGPNNLMGPVPPPPPPRASHHAMCVPSNSAPPSPFPHTRTPAACRCRSPWHVPAEPRRCR